MNKLWWKRPVCRRETRITAKGRGQTLNSLLESEVCYNERYSAVDSDCLSSRGLLTARISFRTLALLVRWISGGMSWRMAYWIVQSSLAGVSFSRATRSGKLRRMCFLFISTIWHNNML